ncbi:MAG: helix-turn-helix transcriptional regulator [Pirellulales bacterium]|nr:helix-turn-helix transcriptional regulator [Pirellulales bacterium]
MTRVVLCCRCGERSDRGCIALCRVCADGGRAMRDDARTVPACDIRTVLEPVIRARGLRHVARCADVTPGAISQWLAGTSDLRLATLRRVVRACGYELVVRRLRGRRRLEQ